MHPTAPTNVVDPSACSSNAHPVMIKQVIQDVSDNKAKIAFLKELPAASKEIPSAAAHGGWSSLAASM